jgi:hypothetical protein
MKRILEFVYYVKTIFPIKLDEKIISLKDSKPLDLGYKLSEGMLGVLIDPDNFMEIPFVLNFLKYRDIEYRLLLDDNILILFPNKQELYKLPVNYKIPGDITDHYIPFEHSQGYGLGWFYRDIIDEGNWQEIIIEKPEDLEELKMLLDASKYNL